MPKAKVRVLDYNTAKPLLNAFVDLGGFTGYTDWRGEITLTVPSEPLPLKVLHRDYSPYSYSLATLLQDSTVEVRLIPLVSIL
jgi:hypothetical protein